MGLHGRGREVIARGHDEILATIFRGTRMTAVVDSVRFLRPDVATVEATLTLQGADGQPFAGSSQAPMPPTKAGYVATKEVTPGRLRCSATWCRSCGRQPARSSAHWKRERRVA